MATYYVTNSGNDANDGLSVATAFATLAHAASVATGGGDKIYISGSHTISADITFAPADNYYDPYCIKGFGTTPGDTGRATLTASGTCTKVLELPNVTPEVSQLIVDCAGVADYGIRFTNSYGLGVYDCWVKNFKVAGISAGYCVVTRCRVSGGISGASYAISTYNMPIACEVHDNAVTTVINSGAIGCLIYNNTATQIFATGIGTTVNNCTIDGNSCSGIGSPGYPIGFSYRNNLITNNGGYGIAWSSYLGNADGNFFYNNTSGIYSSGSPGPNDVTLTADPYTNRAGGDYSLNATAGGGAAVRAASKNNALPRGVTVAYADGGAVQHQDAGGGGGGGSGGVKRVGFNGGLD